MNVISAIGGFIVSVLLAGCASNSIKTHSHVIAEASLKPVALQAAQSVAKVKATAQAIPESPQKQAILTAISETEASFAKMSKQIGAVIKTHERLTRERETLLAQISQKQREILKLQREILKLQEKHGKVVLQRNVLAGVISFSVLALAGLFIGPKLLKLIGRTL